MSFFAISKMACNVRFVRPSLVFDNEITVKKRCSRILNRRNFEIEEQFVAASNFTDEEARDKYSNKNKPNKCGNRIEDRKE